jgi:hypothetical protein
VVPAALNAIARIIPKILPAAILLNNLKRLA